MRRVAVVGSPGSGKTTLGRRLAARLGLSYVELDSIYHQPGWTELPIEQFRDRVRELSAGEGWVIDGNYAAVEDLVWARADTVVWLDLPRRTVVRRVALRSLRRAVTRQQLWNGNREPLSNVYRLAPGKSLVRWTWDTYPNYRERYSAAGARRGPADLRVFRFSTRTGVDAFLEGTTSSRR
jgi:adenylate kinase family enzyme